MMQIQNTRFHINWLGEAGSPYPRYEPLEVEFFLGLEQFRGWLDSVDLPLPVINQWEVSYINHIPRGTVWNAPGDWTFCKLHSHPSVRNVEYESFGGEWHFVIPPERGRLHVRWQHAAKDGGDEMIILTLTARGPASDHATLKQGLDLGHKTIVCTFRDLMSDEANQFWELQDVDG